MFVLSWKPRKDRKKMELQKDRKRIEKGRMKDSSLRTIFFSAFFYTFSIRLISVSYPFAIHHFPILSRFSAQERINLHKTLHLFVFPLILTIVHIL